MFDIPSANLLLEEVEVSMTEEQRSFLFQYRQLAKLIAAITMGNMVEGILVIPQTTESNVRVWRRWYARRQGIVADFIKAFNQAINLGFAPKRVEKKRSKK